MNVESAGIMPGSPDYHTARIVAAALIDSGAPPELVKDSHVALDFLRKRGVTDISKIRPKVRNALIKDLKKEYNRLDRDRKRNLDEQSRLLGQLGSPERGGKQYSAIHKDDMMKAGEALRRPLRFEKPQGSSLHHLIEFMRNNAHLCGAEEADIDDFHARLTSMNFQSFVIEHDWAAAFRTATDFHTGEYPLPFDNTCFEFRINGLRVLMLIGHDPRNNCHMGLLTTGINGRWYVNADRFVMRGGKIESMSLGVIDPDKGVVEHFLNALVEQVRAVCIMLDARVGERVQVRPSTKLNEQRLLKGKPLAREYNVVRLARRYLIRPERHHEGHGSPRQLHLRRGHWRHFDHDGGQVHYANEGGFWVSKTWINWMLVGDPDLGFVEKHYRL